MEKTYEIVGETGVKITKPTAVFSTLSSLKKDLEDAILARERFLKKSEEELAKIDAYIIDLQEDIAETIKLNVREDTK